MKTENALKYLSRVMCLVLMVSLVACGDDDDDDNNDDDDDNDDMMVDELVNTYEFTAASFTDARVVVLQPTIATDPTVITAVQFDATTNSDATSLLRSSIEGAAECAEGVTVGIDLREDGSSFYVCDGDGTEVQQGSWTVDRVSSPAVFTLTIATLTPPVDVEMEGFTLANGVLSGVANIPLPLDATVDLSTGVPVQVTGTGDPLTAESVALLEAGGVTNVSVGDPNIQIVPLEIEFTVVDF